MLKVNDSNDNSRLTNVNNLSDVQDYTSNDASMVQQKNNERRYGKDIKLGSYQMNSALVLTAVIFGILMIPLQLFF